MTYRRASTRISRSFRESATGEGKEESPRAGSTKESKQRQGLSRCNYFEKYEEKKYLQGNDYPWMASMHLMLESDTGECSQYTLNNMFGKKIKWMGGVIVRDCNW